MLWTTHSLLQSIPNKCMRHCVHFCMRYPLLLIFTAAHTSLLSTVESSWQAEKSLRTTEYVVPEFTHYISSYAAPESSHLCLSGNRETSLGCDNWPDIKCHNIYRDKPEDVKHSSLANETKTIIFSKNLLKHRCGHGKLQLRTKSYGYITVTIRKAFLPASWFLTLTCWGHFTNTLQLSYKL